MMLPALALVSLARLASAVPAASNSTGPATTTPVSTEVVSSTAAPKMSLSLLEAFGTAAGNAICGTGRSTASAMESGLVAT